MTSYPPRDLEKVSATDFKAQCLKLIDEVAQTGHELLITKRGKPVARVAPLEHKGKRRPPEALRGSVTYHQDITQPALPPFEFDEGEGVWEK